MLNLTNKLHFLMQAESEPTTTSTAVDTPEEKTETAPAVTAKLSDLVSDETAKEFLNKSTYDADAIVKMAMEGQKANTPASAFTIGDVSEDLNKNHDMSAEEIQSFMADENFMREMIGTAKTMKANQATANAFLTETIKDLHSTEKGSAEKLTNQIITNFGTKEDYDLVVNKANAAMEVVPKDSRIDPKELSPKHLKTMMMLLDGKSFSKNALPGKGVLEKAATGYTDTTGKVYTVNGDADLETLTKQLNEIPAEEKRTNPKFDEFFNNLVEYRKKNEMKL